MLKTRRKELVINMKALIKGFSAALFAVLTTIMAIVGYYSQVLPESYYVSQNGSRTLNCLLHVTLESKEDAVSASSACGGEADGELKLFGVIPIKDASITKTEAPVLIPGGTPVGIKFLTDGVMVVKVQDVADGVCPAVEAGLCAPGRWSWCGTSRNSMSCTSSPMATPPPKRPGWSGRGF